MRVLLSTYGSRGDLEPLAALAVDLKDIGVEPVVCAPSDEEFQGVLARAGVPLFPAFSPVREWVAEALKNPDINDLPRRAAHVMAAQFKALSAAAEGCDVALATGLSSSMAPTRCVAELRGIPYVGATFCPIFLPSLDHPPFAYPGHAHPPEITDNRELWKRDAAVLNKLFGPGLAALRADIGLSPVENYREYVFTHEPILASDPTLSPAPPSDLADIRQTGAWILPDSRPLSADLETFLEAGEPPVYVGFGSMPMQSARDAGRVTIEAIRAQGRRAIVARGWAELGLIDGAGDCFATGDVNQQALFKRVAAVVHHGGAGTTTTTARTGAPQVIVPQIVDQPYWAGRVAALGIGAAHDGPTPTFESLSAALKIALSPETRLQAAVLAGEIRTDGAATAAKMLVEAVMAPA